MCAVCCYAFIFCYDIVDAVLVVVVTVGNIVDVFPVVSLLLFTQIATVLVKTATMTTVLSSQKI